MTTAAEGYLHYYFSDSGLPPFSYKIDAMEQDIKHQIALFSKRKGTAISGSTSLDEAGEILDILLGSDSRGVKKEIFEGKMEGFGQNSGVGEKTYGQLGSMSIDQLNNLLMKDAETLANSINQFVVQLEEYLDMAAQKLLGQRSFKEYQSMLIQNYVNAKQIPRSEAGQAIIKDFLQHNGLKKVGHTASSGAFETALQNLTLLAAALPEVQNLSGATLNYSSGSGKSGKVSGIPQIFQKIAAKVSGSFNNVSGSGAEIAWVDAEIEGTKKVLERIQQVNAQINSIENIHISQTGSDSIERVVGGQTVKRISKGDVTIVIDSGGVKISYGISVKNYKAPNGELPKEITIGSYSNFYNLATTNGKIAPYDLLHYAASKAKRNQKNELVSNWENIKKQVVTRNFLDVVAGQARTAGSDNVLVLVINGNSFGIDEILNAAISQNGEKALVGLGASGLPRERFEKLNVWKRDTEGDGYADDAEERGKNAWNAVQQELIKAKIKISLNGIANLLK